MQILRVAGSQIVLFVSKHTVTNFYECVGWTVYRLCTKTYCYRTVTLPTGQVNITVFTVLTKYLYN